MKNGFLHLTNSLSLFEKLKYDFNELEKDSNDAYKAFNFFVTAEHLPDWVGDTKIKDNNPYLRVSSHLATGAKHFKVTNPKKASVSNTAIDVYVEDGYVHDGYFETVLTLVLTDKEAKELGVTSIPVMALAEEVLSFWKKYFETNNT
ncbi:hypothetical protein TspCOW1_32810 [Thiohalobacter sp. COW1]|uniref:hypothetical protein n=1 Tax=Thiohalobacter sp. COW1 TaxID=2795687 RepID=UPI001916838E|nr:hypothetical protein [Thiohalobacter sp. COW1]BCO33178.1 hypothetical protein TspCOW1_32810 [Thiohalobacter sp. COW1]